jgi:hypothetical protein
MKDPNKLKFNCIAHGPLKIEVVLPGKGKRGLPVEGRNKSSRLKGRQKIKGVDGDNTGQMVSLSVLSQRSFEMIGGG